MSKPPPHPWAQPPSTNLLEPREHCILALERVLPEEQVERRHIVLPTRLPIGIRHGYLEHGKSSHSATQPLHHATPCLVVRALELHQPTWYMSVRSGVTSWLVGGGRLLPASNPTSSPPFASSAPTAAILTTTRLWLDLPSKSVVCTKIRNDKRGEVRLRWQDCSVLCALCCGKLRAAGWNTNLVYV